MPRFLKLRVYDGRIMRVLPEEIAAFIEHRDVAKRDTECHVFLRGATGRDEECFEVAISAEALAGLIEQAIAHSKEG